MKAILNPAARKTLETLSRLHVELEESPLHSAPFEGAAFHVENAIREFIESETGVDIQQADLDLSEHELHADSYQDTINAILADEVPDLEIQCRKNG